MNNNHRRALLLVTIAALGLFASAVHCQEVFGAWSFSVSDDNSFIYAGTTNASKDMLAQFCYPKKGSCIWVIGVPTECEKGQEYPVLANADSGAAQLSMECFGRITKTVYEYALSNFDQVDKLVKKNAGLGFALPIGSDRFRIVRFVLTGATAAIGRMRAAARTIMGNRKPVPGTGTRDQIL